MKHSQYSSQLYRKWSPKRLFDSLGSFDFRYILCRSDNSVSKASEEERLISFDKGPGNETLIDYFVVLGPDELKVNKRDD